MRSFLPATLTWLVLAAAPLDAADTDSKFFFQKGDRIVFLGDSITEQYQYTNYIELYLTTRFPKWSLSFLNAGIGGDTAMGGDRRFEAQVLAEKPTAVTIDFGMNDGGYGKFDPKRQAPFLMHTESMLEKAKKAGVRVALISPNAVDTRIQRLQPYLETQKEFYAPLKGLAAKHGVPFVDQYAATRAVLEQIQADQASLVRPFGDGIHTNPPGGLLMARAILVGLHAPAVVSDVAIDAAAGTKVRAAACTVDKLQASPGSVRFDRKDEALPMPLIEDWIPILPYLDMLKDLNWYGLKVTGLTPGKYALRIDDKEVGRFFSDQLGQGVNLANLMSGPVYAQGQQVLKQIVVKNRLVHRRFRDVMLYQPAPWLADAVPELRQKELANRLEPINALQAEIYKLAQPVAHHFELTRVTTGPEGSRQ